MLTYSFVEKGSDPLYDYLYKCIRNDILQGKLKAGEKLPSKRGFAKNLGVSTITIENAYNQLQTEGYIFSKPKKGYFVCDVSRQVPEPIKPSKTYEVSAPAEYSVDFVTSRTRSENFPFSIWSHFMRQQLSEHQSELMSNSPAGGSLILRQAIADHLWQFHGLKAEPEQIIIGAGTEYLYGLLVQLLGLDRSYAIEDPGYRKIEQVYQAYHVTCRHIPMDESGIRVDQLEKTDAQVVHISPSHHFPTGIVMPVARRYELLGWAAKSDSRYIIEDDYDSEFRMKGRPIPTLQSMDVQEKVIYMNTFTKTLSSTIRISYMVLPRPLVRQFYDTLDFYTCTVSNFEQYTLAAFINKGYFERHITRMRNDYRRQRDAIIHAIAAGPFAKNVTILRQEAGLHFLIKVKTNRDDRIICEQAAKQGIRISALADYYTGPVPPEAVHTFVLNYASVDAEKASAALLVLWQIMA